MLLNDKEIKNLEANQINHHTQEYEQLIRAVTVGAKAQLKNCLDEIEGKTADGVWLNEILDGWRKEIKC